MNGQIAKKLHQSLVDAAKDRTVVDVRIGLGYTAARLNDGSVGVGFTVREGFGAGCMVFQGRRPLSGSPAVEILAMLESSNALEAAVGLATANALANRHGDGQSSGDVLDAIDVKPDDRVGMVGLFQPMMPRLRKASKEVLIFEKADRKAPPEGLLPAEEAQDRLPECQVALLTATAIINGTLDGLLNACRGLREVVVLGSSAPLLPEAFSDTPVTMLSGMIVDRPDDILKAVSEGGGTRSFKGFVSKVNVRVPSK